MHIDMISGIYISLGTGDIPVRMCGSWEKIMVDQRKSRRIFKQVKYSLSSIELSHEPVRMRKCSHAYRHVQWDIH